MTAAVPEPTLEGKIAEVAWQHRLTTPVQCACGWRETDGLPRLSPTSPDRWAAHLAAVLAPLVVEVRERAVEEALNAAADDYERLWQQPGSATGADWLTHLNGPQEGLEYVVETHGFLGRRP